MAYIIIHKPSSTSEQNTRPTQCTSAFVHTSIVVFVLSQKILPSKVVKRFRSRVLSGARERRSEADPRSRARIEEDAVAKAKQRSSGAAARQTIGPRSFSRRSFCSGGPPTGRD